MCQASWTFPPEEVGRLRKHWDGVISRFPQHEYIHRPEIKEFRPKKALPIRVTRFGKSLIDESNIAGIVNTLVNNNVDGNRYANWTMNGRMIIVLAQIVRRRTGINPKKANRNK